MSVRPITSGALLRPITAGALARFLKGLPEDMPVMVLYDCACAEGAVAAVWTGPGPNDGPESVVLFVD